MLNVLRVCHCVARKFPTFIRFAGTRTASETICDFTVKDVDGREMKLDKYRGKPLITVNVASHCGFANSNYRKREELQKIFKDEEPVVDASPCNQFGSQEPGCGVGFKEDVKEKYQNKPDIYDKIEVNGENAHPLYNFLNKIKWNFTKYLVEENGHPVKLYAPTTSPMAIKHDIKSLIYGSKL